MLDSLIETCPLVACPSRELSPGYQHGGGKTYYTPLRLHPLRPEAAEALLEGLLGQAAALQPVKQLLLERSEGNPFFLEESVRALVETQVLDGERGAYRLAKPLERIQVPATVQAILAARIDRLPPEEKQLLQSAAVIGREMAFPLLQAIAELPEDALRWGLAHLQKAEFLYETRLYPEPAYAFKHALTHDVAYSSLLQGQRRVLHARIVEAMGASGLIVLPPRSNSSCLPTWRDVEEAWYTAVKPGSKRLCAQCTGKPWSAERAGRTPAST